MKRILFATAAAVILVCSCTKGLESRVDNLEHRVDNLEDYIANLNSTVADINQAINALEGKVYVTGVNQNANGSYTITFTSGNPITISNGAKGDTGSTGPAGPAGSDGKDGTDGTNGTDGTDGTDGEDGLTPTVQWNEEDQCWYWGFMKNLDDDDDLEFEPITVNGQKVRANGENGATPKFMVKDNVLYCYFGEASADGSLPADAVAIGENLKGDKGDDGDSWATYVGADDDYVILTLTAGGTEVKLARYKEFSLSIAAQYTSDQQQSLVAGENVTVSYTLAGTELGDVVVRAYPSNGWDASVTAGEDNTGTITVTVGSSDGHVDVYAINNITGEIRAKTIDMTGGKSFRINGISNTRLYVSPAGGSVEIPVSTNVGCQVQEEAEWLNSAIADAKTVENKVITLSASSANTSTADYQTSIKITDTDGNNLATFDVIQKNYYPELIMDYVESWTHGNYEGQFSSGGTPCSGKVSIELSDDFSKGAFKVVGFLNYEPYSGAGVQNGTMYADVDGNDIVLYAADSNHQYFSFTQDVTMLIDDSRTKFSLSGINPIASCFCKDYSAIKSLGKAVLTEAESALTGKYDESWTVSGAAQSYEGGMIIEASDEAAYGKLKVTFLTVKPYSYSEAVYRMTSYADLDNGTLTVYTASSEHNYYGPADGNFTFTVTDNNTITASELLFSYNKCTGYEAKKQAAITVEGDLNNVLGTYSGQGASSTGYPPTFTDTFTIAPNGDDKGDLVISGMFNIYGAPSLSSTYYANYSDGVLTILAANSSNATIGALGTDLTMNFDNGTISFTSEGGTNISGNSSYMLTSYTVTRQ